MSLPLTFVASFIFIFLKAFQQRNVAFDHYIPVIPTSLAMAAAAAAEVYVIANVVVKGFSFPLVLAVGLGSGIGAVVAMKTHKLIFRRK